MFILIRPVILYSTKLITDIVTRQHEDANALCPIHGYQQRIHDFYHHTDITADIGVLFEEQPDYDADKSKPLYSDEDLLDMQDEDVRIMQQGEVKPIDYDPNVHKTDFDEYVRHLEHLPDKYLYMYLENIAYRLRSQNSGASRYNRKHPIQRNFMGMGDNGFEVTERVDLVSSYHLDREQLADTESARQHLPYVVKRLHNMSRICRIHVLSFIASYIKAKNYSDKRRAHRLSTSQFKLNDVIRAGIWKCDDHGNITKAVQLGDKNKDAPVLFAWAQGYTTPLSSYYEDMVNFITYCEVLNIDILNDDMSQYQNAFVSKLSVSIVTPNTQFDKLVADAILMRTKQVLNTKTTLATDKFEEVLMEVLQSYESYFMLYTDKYEDYLNYDKKQRDFIFNNATYVMRCQLSSYDNIQAKQNEFSWINGLLHYNGELCAFLLGQIDDNYRGRDVYCVFSDTGYALRIESGDTVYRVAIKELPERLIMLRTGKAVKPLRWEALAI